MRCASFSRFTNGSSRSKKSKTPDRTVEIRVPMAGWAVLANETSSVSMKEKRLIVNGDDMGLSRGITDGILLAYREGLLTSTSLMVNQPATDYAVDQLRKEPKLGAGIHLNLCAGAPVLSPNSIPSLVTPEGKFFPPALIARKLFRQQVSQAELEAEFRAQIRRMKDYGLVPSHADSHLHLHMYPAAAKPFYRAAASEGIHRARAPRKMYFPRNGRIGAPYAGSVCRRLAVKAYYAFLQSVIFRNLTLPDAGVSCHPHSHGKLKLLSDAWRRTLENLPPGVYEIWCHPGFFENGFSETDRLREQREVEIGILTDPQLRNVVNTRGIRLISFNDL